MSAPAVASAMDVKSDSTFASITGRPIHAKNCLQCSFDANEITNLVFYDEFVKVALRADNQCWLGRMVIVPRRHYSPQEISENKDGIQTKMNRIYIVSCLVLKSLFGATMIQQAQLGALTKDANGNPSYAEVDQHGHYHVIPRYAGKGPVFMEQSFPDPQFDPVSNKFSALNIDPNNGLKMVKLLPKQLAALVAVLRKGFEKHVSLPAFDPNDKPAWFRCGGEPWRFQSYKEYDERAEVVRQAVEAVLVKIRLFLKLTGDEKLVITGSLAKQHGLFHSGSDADVAVTAGSLARLHELRELYAQFIQDNLHGLYNGATFPVKFKFTTKPPASLPWVPAENMYFGPGIRIKFDFTFRTFSQHAWIESKMKELIQKMGDDDDSRLAYIASMEPVVSFRDAARAEMTRLVNLKVNVTDPLYLAAKARAERFETRYMEIKITHGPVVPPPTATEASAALA